MNLFELIKNNPKRVVIGFLIFVVFFYAIFVKPPDNFPVGVRVVIEDGISISESSKILENEGVIQSESFFNLLARIFGGDSGVLSGTYSFKRPISVFSVWWRVSNGDTGEDLIRVTIPEGSTSTEIANLFGNKIDGFDKDSFKKLAREKEGYLFPETYIVAPGIKPETIVNLMEETFNKKIIEISAEIESFDASLSDIVIMASLLEREARLYETKQYIAGILWKRISIDMPLQVDAVFGYIHDIETFSPTFDDLEIDSPYNTYKNIGLPPGAISNPGLDSIRATVNPIKSPYFYYLTGSDGTMHYAKTFEEHKANRRFLR